MNIIPTKTEKRTLAAELGKVRRWVSLQAHLVGQAYKKSARSGSHDCKCGQRISKNKATCLKCLS